MGVSLSVEGVAWLFGRGMVVSALAEEAAALEEGLLGLSDSDVVKQTRCVPWYVAALSVHPGGALNQALIGLDGGGADPSAALGSAVDYYSPRVRFAPEVNAADPGRVLEGAGVRVLALG